MTMATIDYKEKYEQAMERARQFCEKPYLEDSAGIVRYIFPELMESDDEKMRAMAIKAVYAPEAQSCIKSWGINPDDVIAWLKNQGNPIDINPSEFDFRINKLLEQFKTLPKEELVSSLNFYLNVVQNDGAYREEKHSEQKPVKWHREDEQNLNACLGYIPDEFLRRWLKDAIHAKYDKPAWSEEDEKQVRQIERIIKSGATKELQKRIHNWLESLEDRVQPKQEWSKEDEEIIDYLIDYLENELDSSYTDLDKETFTKEINWLKSLRPQNRWKPSENELEVLRLAAEKDGVCLMKLYEQLKKLREK